MRTCRIGPLKQEMIYSCMLRSLIEIKISVLRSSIGIKTKTTDAHLEGYLPMRDKKCISCDHIELAPMRGGATRWQCACPIPKWLFGGNDIIDEAERRIVDPDMTGCPAHLESE